MVLIPKTTYDVGFMTLQQDSKTMMGPIEFVTTEVGQVGALPEVGS